MQSVLLDTFYAILISTSRLIEIMNTTFRLKKDSFGCVKYFNRGSVVSPF